MSRWRPSGRSWRVANDAEGVAALVARLAAARPALVALEPTGRHELALEAALRRAGLPLAKVNPRQLREFGRASGRLAKTDRLDAEALAHYGQALRPPPRAGAEAEARARDDLLKHRRHLVRRLVAERQRLATPGLAEAVQALHADADRAVAGAAGRGRTAAARAARDEPALARPSGAAAQRARRGRTDRADPARRTA